MAHEQKYFLILLPLLIFLAGFGTGTGYTSYTSRLFLFCVPRYELGWAAAKGDIGGIDHALSRGANLNAPDGYGGRNALMLASLHGKTRAMQFLIARGADANACDGKG